MNDHKAQLIIRTRDSQDAEVLETLKAIAQAADMTYSEMAMDFIKSGMEDEGFQLPPKHETVEEVLEKVENPVPTVSKNLGDEEDDRVASLASFFEGANPKDVHSLRQDLQEGMSDKEYQSLMDTVKKTPQYEAYRKRALNNNSKDL